MGHLWAGLLCVGHLWAGLLQDLQAEGRAGVPSATQPSNTCGQLLPPLPSPGFNPIGGSTQRPSLFSSLDLSVSSSHQEGFLLPSYMMGNHPDVTTHLVPSCIVHLYKLNSSPALAPIPQTLISPKEADSAYQTSADEKSHLLSLKCILRAYLGSQGLQLLSTLQLDSVKLPTW